MCVDFYFFFSSRRRHTRLTCDWSSDVCSSDLRPWSCLWVLASLGRVTTIWSPSRATPISAWSSRSRVPLGPLTVTRSEERRVGKECRSRGWADHYKKKESVVVDKDVSRKEYGT